MITLLLLTQLAPALLDGRSVMVRNDGVDQDVIETFTQELKSWNRFQIVDSNPDLIVSLKGERIITSNPITRAPVSGISYRLSFIKDDTVLYSDTLKGCCTMRSMIHKTLDKLKDRMNNKN